MRNEAINDLLDDFRLKCQEYYICFNFSAKGIKNSADVFRKNKPNSKTRLWISDVKKIDDGMAVADKNYASISVEKYLESSKYDGSFSNEIAKAFICTIYSLWDENYRNLIANAAKVDQKKVSSDLMGDLRHIRNCIIHSKSIITKEHEKIKIIAWSLAPGELIITGKMFGDFIDQINKMPVAITGFGSFHPVVQKFYDSLNDQEKSSFDSWIKDQELGADIRNWPQWGSVTQRIQ